MASTDITRVAGNIGAMEAFQSLSKVNDNLTLHQTRLASGKRLNEASDDPAGMNMAITFDVRRKDMKVALLAIGDARSLLTVSESGLRKIADILIRLKNKVTEASGDTIGTLERDAIAAQLNFYVQEINQMVDGTQWNGQDLIGTSASTLKQFFVGVTGAGSAVFTDFIFSGAASAGFTTAALGIKSGLGNSTYSAFDLELTQTNQRGTATLGSITGALSTARSGIVQLGAMSARLSFKEDVMMEAHLNTEAAYNRIMNANMAEEQMHASTFTILQQTATAMLAQANQEPEVLMSLFR